MNHEVLTNEHAELEALAARLLAQVRADRPRVDGLSALRWRLNHVLMVHLAQEDNLLYPALLASRDPVARRTAERFCEQMGDLGASYRAYNSEWTFDRVAADWRGFANATRTMMAALRRRIQREESKLYPLIARRAA